MIDKNSTRNNQKITYRDLLPAKLKHVYQYKGSLTTPPCYESVLWHVLDTRSTISLNQVNTLFIQDIGYLKKKNNLFYAYLINTLIWFADYQVQKPQSLCLFSKLSSIETIKWTKNYNCESVWIISLFFYAQIIIIHANMDFNRSYVYMETFVNMILILGILLLFVCLFLKFSGL